MNSIRRRAPPPGRRPADLGPRPQPIGTPRPADRPSIHPRGRHRPALGRLKKGQSSPSDRLDSPSDGPDPPSARLRAPSDELSAPSDPPDAASDGPDASSDGVCGGKWRESVLRAQPRVSFLDTRRVRGIPAGFSVIASRRPARPTGWKSSPGVAAPARAGAAPGKWAGGNFPFRVVVQFGTPVSEPARWRSTHRPVRRPAFRLQGKLYHHPILDLLFTLGWPQLTRISLIPIT